MSDQGPHPCAEVTAAGVASEIDLFCTLVAGSEALAQALVGHPRLEVWRVQAADSIPLDSDQINS